MHAIARSVTVAPVGGFRSGVKRSPPSCIVAAVAPSVRNHATSRPATNVAASSGMLTTTTVTTPEVILALQNGSDVRGVATDGVQGEPVALNEEAAFLIGTAFVHWLAKKVNKQIPELKIAVGRDPRLSGPALVSALFSGFVAEGLKNGIDVGLSTTPACFMTTITKETNCDAGVMLTASHLPFNRNGMKFFTKQGGLDSEDISQICTAAAKRCKETPGGHPVSVPDVDGNVAISGVVCSEYLLTHYSKMLRELIIEGVGAGDKPLEAMKIVVDAGNGSGGFFATHVLEPLGADISGSVFLNPDGSFPNHAPNPEDPYAMSFARDVTVNTDADLGIIFDTDVDRSAVIGKGGDSINRNKLIALLSAIVLEEHPGSTIVTDSVTSDGLASFIESKGGNHLRYMRGYKNVINKGKELNEDGVETHLMIETSGHGAMKENHNLDDGAYIAVKIIIQAVKMRAAGEGGISDLLSELQEPLEEREVRLKIKAADFKAVGLAVIDNLKKDVKAGKFEGYSPLDINYEGLRVRVDEGNGAFGWFLLRQSLHDPVMVLNFESEVHGGVEIMAKALKTWFFEKDFEDVDVSAM